MVDALSPSRRKKKWKKPLTQLQTSPLNQTIRNTYGCLGVHGPSQNWPWSFLRYPWGTHVSWFLTCLEWSWYVQSVRPCRCSAHDSIIQDREAAIRCALAKWLSFTHNGQNVEGILSRYIEIEGLVARRNLAAASSIAAIVHGALQTLADKLAMPPQVQSQLITDAMTVILKPAPYRDAERVIAALLGQGRSIIVIPPYSEVTMQHLLPPRLRSRIWSANEPLSAHFAAPDSFFRALLAQCRGTCPDIRPADILLVSASVSRVTAPASLAGHPTVLLERSGTIASRVQFLVARVPYGNPVPSLVVGDLDVLCERLHEHREVA
ncbi:hypothetical protein GY45DRAFT_153785 [Cubamyces sp. BRFM 1775]|nr:hypothetical protein GY45DRAFT_153785 [Cubamyces sp. BRFM 1775]